jgi:hypothetical protein
MAQKLPKIIEEMSLEHTTDLKHILEEQGAQGFNLILDQAIVKKVLEAYERSKDPIAKKAAEKIASQPAAPVSKPRKRYFSKKVREKMSRSQKDRWAKINAAKNKK